MGVSPWDCRPSDPLSPTEVRSRASIAVAPFDDDSPYMGASSTLPGDPASCSVLGPLNLHLYRDPALQSPHWPLYPPNFPEEALLEAEAELGSQPSLSMSGLGQRQGHGVGAGSSPTAHLVFSSAPEDSEVSSQCPSASDSSGSDSSCVSGQTLGRGLEDLSCVSATLP